MPNWITENKTPITIAVSSIIAVAAIVGTLQTSTNSIHHRLDDMNHRLNDMNHRLNDVRADMNQRFDAQDKHFNQRFDAQDKHFNQRFDDQDRYINQRFDAVDQRLDAQDRRIEDLANGISELRKLSDRVSRNEGEIDIIRRQLKTAETQSPTESETRPPETDRP